MSEGLTNRTLFDYELALAEVPFREDAIRAAAIPKQDLVDHFKNRAVLASDIRALELDTATTADELPGKISEIIIKSTVYHVSPMGSYKFRGESAQTLNEYVTTRNANDYRDLHTFKGDIWAYTYADGIDREEETIYGDYSSVHELSEADVADLESRLYANQPHSTHVSDFSAYVLQQLQIRDQYAKAALANKEKMKIIYARKRAEAAVRQDTKAAQEQQHVRSSVGDYAIAYPAEKKVFEGTTIDAIRLLLPNQPLRLLTGIVSREILNSAFRQAHYEFTAPLLAAMLGDGSSRVFPWGSKFLGTATKIQETLVKGYPGKLSDLTVTLMEPDEELTTKMFANKVADTPPLDKVRRMLWELTLLRTGKPQIISSAESVVYIDTSRTTLTPTILFSKNLRRSGKREIEQSRLDAIISARAIEAAALLNPFSAGLPSLGQR